MHPTLKTLVGAASLTALGSVPVALTGCNGEDTAEEGCTGCTGCGGCDGCTGCGGCDGCTGCGGCGGCA